MKRWLIIVLVCAMLCFDCALASVEDAPRGSYFDAGILSGENLPDANAEQLKMIHAQSAWNTFNGYYMANKERLSPVNIGLFDDVFYGWHTDMNFADVRQVMSYKTVAENYIEELIDEYNTYAALGFLDGLFPMGLKARTRFVEWVMTKLGLETEDEFLEYIQDQLGLEFSSYSEMLDKLNYEFFNELFNFAIDPSDYSHGTHVAGIMGADFWNHVGIQGMYPLAIEYEMGGKIRTSHLYACAKSRYTRPDYDTLSNKEQYDILVHEWADPITYMYTKEVSVINVSRGIIYGSKEKAEKNREAMYTLANGDPEEPEFTCLGEYLNSLLNRGYDFLIVTAAGNESYDPLCTNPYAAIDPERYPEVYARVVVVGNSTNRYTKCYSSNYGDRVYLFAPGCNVLSCVPDGYNTLTGTSQASPYVAGTAAMLRTIYPEATGADIRRILMESATKQCVRHKDGFSEKWYDLLNAEAAVKQAISEAEAVREANATPSPTPVHIKTIAPTRTPTPEPTSTPLPEPTQAEAQAPHIGDIVLFGEYAPYDGTEGTERQTLRWRVLDEQGDQMLLLSEDVLFGCVMDNGNDDGPTDWSDCSFRTWHLRDFVDQAFSPEEREKIIISKIPNTGGKETEDDVFLLSVEEIEYYLSTPEERIAQGTASAMIRGWLQTNPEGMAYWWTRSQGEEKGYFAYVRPDGQIDEDGEWETYSFYGIRPAMWVQASAMAGRVMQSQETAQESNQQARSTDDSENSLRQRLLEDYSGEGELLAFGYEDYDGDSCREAFALLGEYDDEEFKNEAELWYVCSDYAVKCERAGGCYPFASEVLSQDGRICFSVFEGYFGSGGEVRYWSVENERPYLFAGKYMLENLNVVEQSLAGIGR